MPRAGRGPPSWRDIFFLNLLFHLGECTPEDGATESFHPRINRRGPVFVDYRDPVWQPDLRNVVVDIVSTSSVVSADRPASQETCAGAVQEQCAIVHRRR